MTDRQDDKRSERDGQRKPEQDPGNTTAVSSDVNTPYNAGHTHSMGIPDEDQGIIENVLEQRDKSEQKPSAWHGDPLGTRDEDEDEHKR